MHILISIFQEFKITNKHPLLVTSFWNKIYVTMHDFFHMLCCVCEVVASNLHLYSDILVMRFNGFLIMGS